MKQIYHVADPEFWRELKRHDDVAYGLPPNLGQEYLKLRVGRSEIMLAGGYVTAVQLIRKAEAAAVRVTMEHAPRPFVLHLKAEEIGTRRGYECCWPVHYVTQAHGGTRVVFLRMYGGNTSEVSIFVSDEFPDPRNPGYAHDSRTAFARVSDLEKLLKQGKLPRMTVQTDSGTQDVPALPVRHYCGWYPHKDSGMIHLYPEVSEPRVLNAIVEVRHFAEMVRQHPLSPRPRRHRAKKAA